MWRTNSRKKNNPINQWTCPLLTSRNSYLLAQNETNPNEGSFSASIFPPFAVVDNTNTDIEQDTMAEAETSTEIRIKSFVDSTWSLEAQLRELRVEDTRKLYRTRRTLIERYVIKLLQIKTIERNKNYLNNKWKM